MAASVDAPGREDAARLVAATLSIRPADLLDAGEGEFCFAFEWNDEIARVARHAQAAAALRKEVCVLQRIERHLPLSVPSLELFESPEGFPFTLHRKIGGEVLTPDQWLGAAPQTREAISIDVAELLRALHALPVELVESCDLERIDTASRISEADALLTGPLRELAGDEMKAVVSRVLDRWDETQDDHLSILHSDLSPGHLFWDRAAGRLTGVIDFGDVSLGPPARDFIYFYEDFGDDNLVHLLARYAPADAAELRESVRRWFLLELIIWSGEKLRQGSTAELDQALRDIEREVRIGF